MEPVTKAEIPAVETFLWRHAEKAMFPLTNLRNFGLNGTHPYAPRLWMTRENAQVSSVLCITNNHGVMPLCDPSRTLAMLKGRKLFRLIGPAKLCRPVAQALDLAAHTPELDQDEPHFALDLTALRIPDGQGKLLPLGQMDRQTLLEWRMHYLTQTLGMTDPQAARAEAQAQTDRYIANDTHRVLVEGGTPLAMTGFNASLPEIVQIGGVYTPPDRRSQGLARRAVALHLAEARAKGVTRATLFAANSAAQRAYEAIGFERIGDWTLTLLPEPIDV